MGSPLSPRQFGDFPSVKHNSQKYGWTGGSFERERDWNGDPETDRELAARVGPKNTRPFRVEGEPYHYAPHAGGTPGYPRGRTQKWLGDYVDYGLN